MIATCLLPGLYTYQMALGKWYLSGSSRLIKIDRVTNSYIVSIISK